MGEWMDGWMDGRMNRMDGCMVGMNGWGELMLSWMDDD